MARDEARGARAGEWRLGWPVVAAAMVGIGTGPGLYQNFSSLFVDGMVGAFGWSRGEIATAAGFGLLGALGVPVLGRLADHWGTRPVIVTSTLLLATTYVGFASMTGSLWEYQALVFCLSLTIAGTSPVVFGKLIAVRFKQHRGVALGVATSGLSITSLILSPALAAILTHYGWRIGFASLGALVALVALPTVLALLRGAIPPSIRVGPVVVAMPDDGMTGSQARRDGRFWRLGLCAALVNAASVGLLTSLVPFGTDRGLSLEKAALLLTAFAAGQIVGRLLMGVLVDRFRPQATAALLAGVSALALIGLQMPEPGLATLLGLVFCAGLMNGAEYDLLPFLTARLFGLLAYGENFGLLLALALIGTASGIIAFGRLHDATSSYSAALVLATFALSLAAVLFSTLSDRGMPKA